MTNKITIFRDIKDINGPNHITLSQSLKRIKEGKSKELISQIREGDKEAKKKLPVVCFSGEFSSRKDDALFEHSGIIVLDFDHVDVEETKQALGTDDYVYACWTSPSGDGVKALVRITNPERHRDHFRAISRYFERKYALEVDPSGINESRACFESYDPDILIKDSDKFGAFTSEKAELGQTIEREGIVTDYMKLNLAARMIRMAEDGEKHKALHSAARLCGGFISAGRMEEDEVVRILLREIGKRDIDSEQTAINTVRDGIESGKNMPIKELVANEKDAKRELLLNDGDMSFISSDDEDFRWIDDYANGKIEVGLDTGNELIDKHFRYKKEFVIVNGHSNVGKTTMMLYLIANSAVRHDWKWLIYSSENRTASVKMTLMQFAKGRKVGDMGYGERKSAYKWVQQHFTIINNHDVYSYSDIVLFMEKTMKQQDLDGIFIDPYNSLKLELGNSGLGAHDYHYEAASEFLTFSKSHNVAVWLNMHAVTEAQRRKGDDGLPVAPYAEDTEGGGKFVNRADCFLTIHRKVQAPDMHLRKMTELHVRKIREVETGGEPTPLDEPIKFIFDLSHTGFKEWTTQKPLYKPVSGHNEQQSQINLSPNINFLS